ncbi:MAG: hypothetical protein WC101_04075 [Candidatus Gracilibacteria bacterium]
MVRTSPTSGTQSAVSAGPAVSPTASSVFSREHALEFNRLMPRVLVRNFSPELAADFAKLIEDVAVLTPIQKVLPAVLDKVRASVFTAHYGPHMSTLERTSDRELAAHARADGARDSLKTILLTHFANEAIQLKIAQASVGATIEETRSSLETVSE